MSITDNLRPVLENTGLPWAIKPGKRHHKIYVADRLIGIFPLKDKGDGGRALLNIISQIRRAGKIK